MDENLKRRIVGASVLISLAVIFVPMWLDDGTEPSPEATGIDIPPRPREELASPVVPLSPEPPARPAPVAPAGPQLSDPSMEVFPTEAAPVTGALLPTRPAAGAAPAVQAGPLYGPPPAPVEPHPPVAVAAPEPKPAVNPPVTAAKPEAKPPVALQKPEQKPATAPTAAKPAPAAPAAQVAAAAKPAQPTPPAPAPAVPPPRTNRPAWVVQVASLGTQGGATAMVQELRGKGYPAFYEATARDGKTTYRVSVGPQLDRSHAIQTQEELKGWLGTRNIRSQVRSYP